MRFSNRIEAGAPEAGLADNPGAAAFGTRKERRSPGWRRRLEQAGFVVGTDLIFLVSCMLCVAIVAWGSFGTKLIQEWGDQGDGVGELDQSYTATCGIVAHPNHLHNANNPIAFQASSSFTDRGDFCDQGCSCGIVMCITGDVEPGYKSCT